LSRPPLGEQSEPERDQQRHDQEQNEGFEVVLAVGHQLPGPLGDGGGAMGRSSRGPRSSPMNRTG